MEAEVGDLDAGQLGRLDQVDVLGDLDRLSVEDDGVGVFGRRGRGRRRSRSGRGARDRSAASRRHRRLVAHACTGRRESGTGGRDAAAPGPTRQRRCSTWWRNSWRNFPTEESTGAIAASAKTQMVIPLAIWLEIFSKRSMSSG